MSRERYLNLLGGHFPFFSHSICFRVIAFAFLCIYLDLKTAIPLFLIWLSNIIIGCVIAGKQNVTQVCLNSFLSILVPSCLVFSGTDGLTDKQNEDHQKVKSFQQKVIKFQVSVSTTILLLCLSVVFYLVNYTEYKYNNNSFSNFEFNIICCMILGLGVISYLFLFGIDIYELLHLNNKPAEGGEIIIKYKEMKNESEDMGKDVDKGVKITVEIPVKPDEVEYIERPITTKKHRPCKKLMVSVMFTVLAVSPMLAGYTYISLATNSPAYLVIKMTDNAKVNIQMAKSRLLNFPSPESKLEAEGLLRICGKETANTENLLRCQNALLDQGNQILLVDMKAYNCIEELKKMDHTECLPYKGIVLMENFDHSSSRPVNFNFQRVTKFPIISVSYRDSEKILSGMQDGQLVNMIFDDFDNMFEMGTSEIYQVYCSESGCTSFQCPERASKRKYIGCDGEIKLRAEVTMTCTSNGRRCPELETWKRKIEKSRFQFESCFQIADKDKNFFPPAHCVKAAEGEVEMPLTCDQEEVFWNGNSNLCWNEQTKSVTYWKKECRNETECESWASWSHWITPPTCDPKTAKERFRFCRKNRDCVLMEREKKYGKSGPNSTCTEDDVKDDYSSVEDCKFS